MPLLYLLLAVLSSFSHVSASDKEEVITSSSVSRQAASVTRADSRCFATSVELRQAVDAYLYDDSNDTEVASIYGWPIGTWCVDAIENFDSLFSWFRNRKSATFNEDISAWNVSRATSMKSMFFLARDFDQDLCAWGDVLDVATTSFNLMFRGTSCTSKRAPSVDLVPAGPFCDYCFPPDTTSSPSTAPSSPSFSCFMNSTELRSAVAAYLIDNSSGTDVARTYGWPIGSWCVSAIEDFSYLFRDAVDFNEDIRDWDVSRAVSMEYMFFQATSFNKPIGNWDVSTAVLMNGMFYNASSFNKPIGEWNVSNVSDFANMFLYAEAFNQQLENWSVSNAVSMWGMFCVASSFNQPIEGWDVSKVENMHAMFYSAASFNQPLTGWNVSGLRDVGGDSVTSIFESATSFNQDLCAWGDHITVAGTFMFSGTACPNTSDPVLSDSPPGPFCHDCL